MAVKKRKISKFVAVTMAIFVVLYAVVFSTSLYVQKAAEQQCYDTSRKTTENLGKEIKNNTYNNQEQLEIIADVIASRGNIDSDQTKHILKSYMTRGEISHLEVLLPDNRVITCDGNYVDASGTLSYAEEVEKGEYVSTNATVDISYGDKKVLKSAVPILQKGETIGILYGITEVNSLPLYYVADSYAENASIYLIDGDSGDFIMDTWHLSLGNIADWSKHKVKGQKTSEIDTDIKSGKSGYLVGYSERVKENMYSYYTPVGINNWSVMLSIPESTVMKIARQIEHAMYGMAIITVAILVAYFVWLLALRKKDIERVEYMLEVEKSLFDAHKHTENIENTLGTVADYMKAETAFFTKVKNGIIDEVYCWSNKDDFDINAAENRPVKVVIPGFNGDGTSMKFGKKLYNLRDCGLPYDYYIDSYIVTSVYDVKKRFVGVLGVVNMDKVWKNADYIENVAGTFSLAVNNISSYQSLRKMGIIDSLTGLLNRNCFERTIENLDKNEYRNVACVYIDANGLHNINNRFGHEAGDNMLKAVAQALQSKFGSDKTYRIGGDEFVAFTFGDSEKQIEENIESIKNDIEKQGYSISYGVSFSEVSTNAERFIKQAERNMLDNKYSYYHKKSVENNKDGDWTISKANISEHDMDTFLSAVAPKFTGGYIVNFDDDTVRVIYVPKFFKSMLKITNGKFKEALRMYLNEKVDSKYHRNYEPFFDYEWIERQIQEGNVPEIEFERTNGELAKMHIIKAPDYSENHRETVWIFETIKEVE
ncbi:MAG: diguanylate cyclase domain-containing protein [Hominilimicola sp.]|uniref:sensor domain-containing diguanylate cyclase n=1 Tax=Hominilimicola sp. TaxID=3073571 RepID=UPI0039999096